MLLRHNLSLLESPCLLIVSGSLITGFTISCREDCPRSVGEFWRHYPTALAEMPQETFFQKNLTILPFYDIII